MRKIMLLASCVALLALVLVATPAMAQSFDFDRDNDDLDNGFIFDRDNDDDLDNGFIFDRDNDFDNNRLFNNEFEQETDETGDVSLSTEVVQTGNNSNQCVAPLQFGNTGNLQNAQGFSSFGTSSNNGFDDNGFFDFNNDFNTNVDDVEFEGSTFEFNPEQVVECAGSVEQAAAASSL
jgi:hypothetical protein